jgi:hypothetical protein
VSTIARFPGPSRPLNTNQEISSFAARSSRKIRLSGGKADGSNNHDWPDPDIYAGRRTATRISAFSESALNCLEPGTTNRVVVLSRLPT